MNSLHLALPQFQEEYVLKELSSLFIQHFLLSRRVYLFK